MSLHSFIDPEHNFDSCSARPAAAARTDWRGHEMSPPRNNRAAISARVRVLGSRDCATPTSPFATRFASKVPAHVTLVAFPASQPLLRRSYRSPLSLSQQPLPQPQGKVRRWVTEVVSLHEVLKSAAIGYTHL